MTKPTRQERADALEMWADAVDVDDLREADTAALRTIAELADQHDAVKRAIEEAVRQARADNHSWSQIGAMLGVSKQAAQRKYANV